MMGPFMKMLIGLALLTSLAAAAATKPLTPDERNNPFPTSPAKENLNQQMQINAQQQKQRILQQQDAQRDKQRSQLQSQLDLERQRAEQGAPQRQNP